MTEALLLEEFLLNPNRTENTRERYKRVLREFIKFFPSKLVKEITGKDVLEYLYTKPEGSFGSWWLPCFGFSWCLRLCGVLGLQFLGSGLYGCCS